MARIKGQSGYLEVGGVEVGERVSFNLEISAAEFDATVQGLDWTSTLTGQLTASGEVEVLYDPADAGQTAMMNGIIAGTVVVLDLFPGGESTGLKKYSGNFVVLSASIPVPTNDLVKTTFSVKNDGAVTITTIT